MSFCHSASPLLHSFWQSYPLIYPGNTKGGSITVPLTSCLTGLDWSLLQIKNKNCQLSYSWFQTSQSGGQLYSDTSPFSIPWLSECSSLARSLVVTKCTDMKDIIWHTRVSESYISQIKMKQASVSWELSRCFHWTGYCTIKHYHSSIDVKMTNFVVS